METKIKIIIIIIIFICIFFIYSSVVSGIYYMSNSDTTSSSSESSSRTSNPPLTIIPVKPYKHISYDSNRVCVIDNNNKICCKLLNSNTWYKKMVVLQKFQLMVIKHV